ncbi:protein gp37 [Pseudacidovorax sp. 1753]|uniref:phage Gp37/Gp68 family protein n=1 Tax=Pseudacidovorax sp. 1753 TaxID=3156419 RepID=UPI003399A7C9
MSASSNIEWCDSTFNPWTGCAKVSPACDHCYAEGWSKRAGARVGKWGAGAPRVRTVPANWRHPVVWNETPFSCCQSCRWRGETRQCISVPHPDDQMPTRGCPACKSAGVRDARRRVFCASLADWLDNEVPIDWLVDLLDLVRTTPALDWLLLTKRIGNLGRIATAAMVANQRGNEDLRAWCVDWWSNRKPPANVWLGITVCDQKEAGRDIPKLLDAPAAKRFLSMEPLLGPVQLPLYIDPARSGAFDVWTPGIDWVIVGGESGPGARPMHPAWARSLRDQCAEVGVPFLFKQWGEWSPRAAICGAGQDFQTLDPQCTRWPDVIRLGEHGRDTRMTENCTADAGEDVFVQRVGKKAAGRLLDGRTHDGFPS